MHREGCAVQAQRAVQGNALRAERGRDILELTAV